MRYATLCFLFLVSGLSSCWLFDDCNTPGTVDFLIPATLTPAQDTFRIGDTIHIVSSFGDAVFETKTERRYLLENWYFLPLTSVIRIDTNPALSYDGLLDFRVLLNPEHNYGFDRLSGITALSGEYSYHDQRYYLDFALIPQKAGLYMFSHGSGLDDRIHRQNFPGKCRGTLSSVHTQLNNGADNNIHLLAQSPDPRFKEMLSSSDKRFHRSGGYCFVVVE